MLHPLRTPELRPAIWGRGQRQCSLCCLPVVFGLDITAEPGRWGESSSCHSPILRAAVTHRLSSERGVSQAQGQAGPAWKLAVLACSPVPPAESPSRCPPQLALCLMRDSELCPGPASLAGLLPCASGPGPGWALGAWVRLAQGKCGK